MTLLIWAKATATVANCEPSIPLPEYRPSPKNCRSYCLTYLFGGVVLRGGVVCASEEPQDEC